MKNFNLVVLLLILVGAINWGLWGFFQFNFIAWICGSNTNAWSRIIYAIIGVAGLWGLSYIKNWKALSCCCTSRKKEPVKSASKKRKGKRAA